MATKKQNKANKQNSLLSTGPSTVEGKVISSRNSLQHGILSKDLIIKDESITEFEEMRKALYKDLNIDGVLEEILAEKMLNSLWRLRRVLTAESEMFKFNQWEGSTISSKFKGCDSSCMQSLSRYESLLERNFYKALHEIQRLQAVKCGNKVIAPIAVDISNQY
ncbi:MAG: hypothetical protein ACFFG0_06670 [Candidatus Thorarchaeota archaeon]